MKPRRTQKQREIMSLVLEAVSEGRFITTKEIHERLSYECSYGAVRISVRFLVEQGMLVRKPEGNTTGLVPTESAYTWFRTG